MFDVSCSDVSTFQYLFYFIVFSYINSKLHEISCHDVPQFATSNHSFPTQFVISCLCNCYVSFLYCVRVIFALRYAYISEPLAVLATVMTMSTAAVAAATADISTQLDSWQRSTVNLRFPLPITQHPCFQSSFPYLYVSNE